MINDCLDCEFSLLPIILENEDNKYWERKDSISLNEQTLLIITYHTIHTVCTGYRGSQYN